MQQPYNIVEEVAFNLIKQAAIYLPNDVKFALQKAYDQENSQAGRTQLKAILDNVALAEKQQVPICQDTGTIIFYVTSGSCLKSFTEVESALVAATRKATSDIPLRPNAVNPFTNQNSGDNVGRFVPQIHWEFTESDCIEITVMLKGGGSENACVLGMLNPGEGMIGLKRFVVDAVAKAGAQSCPPTIIGVGVGGGADAAIFLAKKALLRPIGEVNIDVHVAKLEQELFEAVNMSGVGPMGLGGKISVLDVHIDYAFRHPASYPVAVAFGCWACRRASAKICSDNTVTYLTQSQVGVN